MSKSPKKWREKMAEKWRENREDEWEEKMFFALTPSFPGKATHLLPSPLWRFKRKLTRLRENLT